MKKSIASILTLILFSFGSYASHAASPSHGSHDTMKNMEHEATDKSFTHEAIVEGIEAKFQVMSLASMNMKGEEGETHHIMVSFLNEGSEDKLMDVTGKIKVIDPAKKEQLGSLKNYNGIYAANFGFTKPGKYGIICLFKNAGQKRVAKFWYNHD